MNELNELKRMILKALDELGNASTDELISYLQSKSAMNATAVNIRRALSQLIREGVIAKIPDVRKKKFVLVIMRT